MSGLQQGPEKSKAMGNPNGYRGRYTIRTAVVGSCGVAVLDDGTIVLCYVGPESKCEPILVRGPSKR